MKAPVLLFFLYILSLPVLGQSAAYQTLLKGLYDSSFPVVKPLQIKDLSLYQVLDAREKEEYAVSHLPQALWIGHETFSLKTVAHLDKTAPVLIYCTVGARSEQIGKILNKEGFSRVYNLYGGILQWANEGRPLIAQEKPTQRVHTYSSLWGIWLTRGEKVH